MPHPESEAVQQSSSLAASLGCFTEAELLTITGVKLATAKSWRMRGEGPAYIRAGKNFLYPRKAVSDWLATRGRERKSVPAGALL
jgi:hypothetical protein